MSTELYELRISGTHQQEYFENVLNFVGENLVADDVIANADDLLLAFASNVQDAYLDMLPGSTQLRRLTAIRSSPLHGVGRVREYQEGDWPGTAGATAQSQQLCPILRLIPPMGVKTAGRFFLPGIATADINSNVVQNRWTTAAATLMGLMLAGFTQSSITWTIGIRSRATNSYHKAVDYDTSPIIGWQRRRERPY